MEWEKDEYRKNRPWLALATVQRQECRSGDKGAMGCVWSPDPRGQEEGSERAEYGSVWTMGQTAGRL